MESDLESADVHYAIIEAIRTDAPPELLVIPYRTEQALRLVIADFCIIATGFPSREAATKMCEAQLYSAA